MGTNKSIRWLATMSLLGASSLLSGCGYRFFADRPTNPVIEDGVNTGTLRQGTAKQKRVGVLSTRAERRTIIFLDNDWVCAEPPPDVAEAVSSQLLAKIERENINAGVSTNLQTAIMQLGRRSQGLELFRSGTYALCNMYINKVLEPADYQLAFTNLVAKSSGLIEKEIATLPTVATAIAQVAQSQGASAITFTTPIDKPTSSASSTTTTQTTSSASNTATTPSAPAANAALAAGANTPASSAPATKK